MASRTQTRIGKGGRGVIKGGPPATKANPPTALPNQLDIVGDEEAQRSVIEAEHKLQGTDDYLGQIAKGWNTAVKDLSNPVNWAAYLHARAQVNQVDLLSMGYQDTMALLAHPTNYLKLLPAIDCINNVAPVIRRLVPLALQDIDLKAMMGQRDWLQFLRNVRAKEEVFLRGLDVLIVHNEQDLYATADQVNRSAGKLGPEHFELGQGLGPLHELFSGSAEAGVGTKQDYAKVREQTRNTTLEQVKEAMAPQEGDKPPSEPVPGGTPIAEPPSTLAQQPPAAKGHPRGKTRK